MTRSGGAYRRVLLGSFFAALIWAVAAAVPAQAITIIPPTLDFQISPGLEYNTTVKLFNETDSTVTYYTEVTSFTAAGESGRPQYNFGAPSEDLSSWIEVGAGPFALESGERISVPIKITAPADAGPGGHYAAVFFSDVPPSAAGGGTVTVGSKIGILLLARITGDVVEKGSVKEFYAGDHTSSFSRLPVHFVTRYENTGNVFLRPTGTIEIKNMLGRPVTSLEFNSANGATLHKSIRKYENVWQKSEVQGNESFWSQYRNERNNFAFGKYTAHLALSAGVDSVVKSTADVSFWVFPWHFMLVWGAALLVALFLLWLLIRRYNHWLINRALHQQKTSEQPKTPKR